MKKIFVIATACLLVISCKNDSKEIKIDETRVEKPADSLVQQDTVASVPERESIGDDVASQPKSTALVSKPAGNYASFGANFSPQKAIDMEQMLSKYKSLKSGDTIAVQFKSLIKEVCSKKGCWMSMELPDEAESFVRFKDYGFFVPLNAGKSEAIVSGKAYLDVISVAQLQHYAKDGGKSELEISQITKPKITYAFQADGVLIKK